LNIDYKKTGVINFFTSTFNLYMFFPDVLPHRQLDFQKGNFLFLNINLTSIKKF